MRSDTAERIEPGKSLADLRIQNEKGLQNLSNDIDYVAPNLFAGSIFDLEPDTEYECVFQISDPDGVEGDCEKIVIVKTRFEPEPCETGQVYHVYPFGYTGEKQEPAFPNLLAAYYTGWCEADWWNVAPPRVHRGILYVLPVFTKMTELYGADNSERHGNPFQGTYYLTGKEHPKNDSNKSRR